MRRIIMIKNLETRLNEYWSVREEMYIFTVERIEDRENASRVVVKCFSDDEESKELVWLIGVNENNDSAALIDDLIKEFYDKYINTRNRSIKGFSGYCNRKLNSLNKAINKGDTDKVTQINLDLLEQYKVMKQNKSEVSFYKMFIKIFYSIKGD
jgi:molybdopterin converting factor small subunit